MSTQSILNDFLNLINYSNVYQLPNAQTLHTRNSQRLTGKDLIRQNIEREAHRLHLYSQHIINLATNDIWNLRSTSFQRNKFKRLANDANNINQNRVSQIRLTNTNTIDQIVRLTVPQITSDPFENNFFNGVKDFDDGNNSFESLVLPAGCLGSSSFP
jgi:hypothetical protein